MNVFKVGGTWVLNINYYATFKEKHLGRKGSCLHILYTVTLNVQYFIIAAGGSGGTCSFLDLPFVVWLVG